MSWYEFLLFFHISMAVLWVGGAAMIQFFALRIMKATDPMRMAEFGQDVDGTARASSSRPRFLPSSAASGW